MNIFRILKKGNIRNEEYFSSSLAFILNEIPELTHYIFHEVFELEQHFGEFEVILEEAFEEGRLDIAIKSLELEVYIENKISAPLGEKQLERYSNILRKKPIKTKLILLSKDYLEDDSIEKYADKYIFWSKLYELIEIYLIKYSNNIKEKKEEKVYLIKQFIDFIREENMSNEKVSWEYSNGLASFLNLLNMIQTILADIQKEGKFIKNSQKEDIGTKWAGFTIYDENKKGEFWVGITYNDKDKLYFEYLEDFVEKCKNSEKLKTLPIDYYEHPAKSYDFNKEHFFAFTKEEQKNAIHKFIKESLEFAEEC
jgi:hypothetical protein